MPNHSLMDQHSRFCGNFENTAFFEVAACLLSMRSMIHENVTTLSPNMETKKKEEKKHKVNLKY